MPHIDVDHHHVCALCARWARLAEQNSAERWRARNRRSADLRQPRPAAVGGLLAVPRRGRERAVSAGEDEGRRGTEAKVRAVSAAR